MDHDKERSAKRAKHSDESKAEEGEKSEAVSAAQRFGLLASTGKFDAGSIFKGIPSEIVLKTMTFIDPSVLVNLQVSSKTSYRVLRHEDVWRATVSACACVTAKTLETITSQGLTWELLGREFGRVLRNVSRNCLHKYPVPRILRDLWFEIVVAHKGRYINDANDQVECGEEGNASGLFGVPNLSFWSLNNTCVFVDNEEENEEFVKKLKHRVAWIGFVWQTEESRALGYWLGGKKGKHEYKPDTAPVFSWQCYQGPETQFRTSPNLSSQLLVEGEPYGEETTLPAWLAAHGSVEKVLAAPKHDDHSALNSGDGAGALINLEDIL